MVKFIGKIVRFFYFPFIRKIIPEQTFTYAFCGSANMALDMVLYFLIYHFILLEQDIVILKVTISSSIAAFLITFPIVFLTGLWLAKNVTFKSSINSNKKQVWRYFSVTLLNIFLKYFGIKVLIFLYLWPSFANAIMTVITVVVSYLLQKYYTFKGNKSY